MMKLRSNVDTARSSRFSAAGPWLSSCATWNSWKVLVSDPFLVGDGHQALDEVFQLSDVAGPPVGAEDAQRGIGDSLNVLPEHVAPP